MIRHSFYAVGFALAFAGFMVWNLTRGFEDFFLIDDALNEMLPFYREMGRLWLAGEVPFLTERAFVGGNLWFDLVLSIFLPQVVATSILSALTEDPRLPANFLAFVNITGAVLGGYAFARALKIEHAPALLVGMTAGARPFSSTFFKRTGGIWLRRMCGFLRRWPGLSLTDYARPGGC